MRLSRVLPLVFVLFVVGAHNANASMPTPPSAPVVRDVCPYAEWAQGCVDGDTAYVKPGAGPFVYWHELGHLYDDQVLSDAHRAKYQALTNDHGEWLPDWSPDGSPSERFADAYAICAMHATGRRQYGMTWWDRPGDRVYVSAGSYGYTQPLRRHRRVCQLIWNAAGIPYAVARAPWERR